MPMNKVLRDPSIIKPVAIKNNILYFSLACKSISTSKWQLCETQIMRNSNYANTRQNNVMP